MYKRLFKYLRPHAGLMGVTIVTRLIAAALDVFSAALLLPFLNLILLKDSDPAPQGLAVFGDSDAGRALEAAIGQLTDGKTLEQQLATVIVVILSAVVVKNLFIWWGGSRRCASPGSG